MDKIVRSNQKILFRTVLPEQIRKKSLKRASGNIGLLPLLRGCIFGILFVNSTYASVQFTEVTSLVGFTYSGGSYGASWGDFSGDGLPDLWEYRNFGGKTNAVVTANPDGDAYTNLEEYIAGLNPNVFDTFEVLNFTVGASNMFEWNAVSDRVYNVYWSSNLLDGFTRIESNATGGVFIDMERTGDPAGFYRITVGFE